jgi:hypothetical protein
MARKIEIVIAGDASSLERSLGVAKKAAGGFKSSLGGIAKTAAGVFGGLGAAAAAQEVAQFGADAVKAAVEDEKSQAELARTLKASTGARKGDIASVERWISAQGKALGVTDDDLRPSLAALARATGDVGEAQKLAALAMDISAATGKPLATVTQALVKAQNGQTAGLGRLGIKTKDAAGKALTFAQIQDQLRQKMGDAAETAANTAGGKFKRFQVQMDELKESIGAKLLPILLKLGDFLLTKVIPAIEKTVAWVQEHWPEIQRTISDVMQRVRAVIENVVNIIQQLWARFGDTILNHLKQTWNNIRTTVEGVINIVRGIIQTVTALIRGDWGKAWDGIKMLFSGVWEAIKGIVGQAIQTVKTTLSLAWDAIEQGVKTAFGKVLEFFRNLPGNIMQAIAALPWLLFTFGLFAIGKLLSGVKNAALDVFNWFAGLPGVIMAYFRDAAEWLVQAGRDIVKGLLDGIAGAPGSIGDALNEKLFGGGKGTFHIPGTDFDVSVNPVDWGKAPGGASGGVIPGHRNQPFPMVAHGGELLLNDEQNRRIVSAIAAGAPAGSGGTATATMPVQFVFNGVLDARDAEDRMIRLLDDYRRRNGRLPWETN